jgi:transposase-like protein
MSKKYTEPELSRAILMIVDEEMPISEVAAQTGINYRALYRYRDRYIKGKQPPKQKKKEDKIVVLKETTAPNAELQRNIDTALIERAKFMEDVFKVKQILLGQIMKISMKSQNLDAMQRTLKTLCDLEETDSPKNETPGLHADTVNMFQFFNQKLIDEGYEGPPLTDADIVKGD